MAAKKLRMVRVRWVDSAATSKPWMADGETLAADKCVSIGYLVEKTKKKLLLAQSRSSCEWGNPLAIPRVAVTSIRRVK